MTEFEELLRREMTVLERFVKYRIGDLHSAEDVLQETCLAAMKNFESLSDKTSFKSWLLGIARHKCSDHFREKAKSLEIPIEELNESVLILGAQGVTTVTVVRETLDLLGDKEKQILYLHYFRDLPQEEIAKRLSIPVGTVKSRLHYAKQKFRQTYPFRPKGVDTMSKFPEKMPEYTIVQREESPFAVMHRELPGMFIIPAENEALSFAMYDLPEGKLFGQYQLKVTGKINVHGIEGVEIESRYREGAGEERSVIFAQLTDTHVRYLGDEHTENGCRKIVTFLDEEFESAYSIGENNCGFPIERKSERRIVQKGSALFYEGRDDVSDVAGRFAVTISGNEYDTVRLIDVQNGSGGIMLCEYYLDESGKTVLWRRFNADDWAIDRYKKPWSEILPENERMAVNGKTFVHWYDCITDHIL